MFGGVGIYTGDLFFALIASDILYLKVDDSNRGDFEARGLGPFRPFGETGEVMQYYELTNDIVEDPGELRSWAVKAIDVARRKRKRGVALKPAVTAVPASARVNEREKQDQSSARAKAEKTRARSARKKPASGKGTPRKKPGAGK
jgi:DNA transformation protein